MEPSDFEVENYLSPEAEGGGRGAEGREVQRRKEARGRPWKHIRTRVPPALNYHRKMRTLALKK